MPSTPTPQLPEVRVPLWVKMALFFGPLMGGFVAGWGWLDFNEELERERDLRQARMVGLAQTLAAAIDGPAHAGLQRSADAQRPEHGQMMDLLRAAREANDVAWIGTSARDSRDNTYYVVDGGDPPPYPIGYPIFDGDAARAEVYDGGGPAFDPRMEDEWGLWTVALAPIRGDGGEVVGLVEVMDRADQRELSTQEQRDELLRLTLLVLMLAVLISAAFSRTLVRHLGQITDVALDVAGGQLDRELEVRTRDEIGVLTAAFNAMIRGLREREIIRETFGRFVSEEVARKVLDDPSQAALGGELRRVTVLMSDLRGFSSLSGEADPAYILALLNRYFTAMTEVIQAHDGVVSELVGDGIVALFGAPTSQRDDPLRAVACAVSMQVALRQFNEAEGLSLEMGIGIGTGEVIAGNIGGTQRMKYGVVGPTINLAARLEGFTVGNQVLISAATRREAGDAVEVGEELEVLAKGWSLPLRCSPVIAVGPPFEVAMPEEQERPLTPLDLPLRCRRIEKKRVEQRDLHARLTAANLHRLTMHGLWSPRQREQLKVKVLMDQGESIEELYGVVVAVEPAAEGQGYRSELRLTSVPQASRARLRRIIGEPS